MAHVAEVVTQTIRNRTNLVGFDVILVHRLLKNPVEIPEYVLMSEELYRAGESAVTSPAQEISSDLEGIGLVHAYFVDVESLEEPLLPALPELTWRGRLGRTFAAAGLGMPYLLGLRRRRALSNPLDASSPSRRRSRRGRGLRFRFARFHEYVELIVGGDR